MVNQHHLCDYGGNEIRWEQMIRRIVGQSSNTSYLLYAIIMFLKILQP